MTQIQFITKTKTGNHNMAPLLAYLASLVLFPAVVSSAVAGDSRAYPDAVPPIHWSVPDGKGVLWSADPGSGASMPLVVGDLVVVLVEPETIVALDQKTGKELCRHELCVFDLIDGTDKVAGKEAMAKTVEFWRQGVSDQNDDRAKQAAPYWAVLRRYGVPVVCANHYDSTGYTYGEPVTDGKYIYVKFTSGSIAAITLDGNIVWRRRGLVNCRTTLASPGLVVVDGKIIYKESVVGKDNTTNDPKWLNGRTVLVALDAATGTPVWRSPAFRWAEHGEWAGLSVATLAGIPLIITPGGVAVRVIDGKVIAEGLGGCVWGARGSGGPDVAVFGQYVVPLKAQGEEIIVPKGERGSRWTGVVSGSRVYSWEGAAFQIADLTGKVLYSGNLDLGKDKQGIPYNGPGSIVGGFLVRVADPETVAIVSLAGDKPQIVASNPMGGACGAPAAAGSRLFFRMGARLVAIGDSPLPNPAI